jgi:hypothetical protein
MNHADIPFGEQIKVRYHFFIDESEPIVTKALHAINYEQCPLKLLIGVHPRPLKIRPFAVVFMEAD